jgi:hypothetical protein
MIAAAFNRPVPTWFAALVCVALVVLAFMADRRRRRFYAAELARRNQRTFPFRLIVVFDKLPNPATIEIDTVVFESSSQKLYRRTRAGFELLVPSIVAGVMNANEIAAGTITADKIAADMKIDPAAWQSGTGAPIYSPSLRRRE